MLFRLWVEALNTNRAGYWLFFAFPKELEAREKDYPLLFTTFNPGIKEEKGLKEYIASGRRLKFSNGLFRKYPELDRQ
jgi:glutathione S-transferase